MRKNVSPRGAVVVLVVAVAAVVLTYWRLSASPIVVPHVPGSIEQQQKVQWQKAHPGKAWPGGARTMARPGRPS
jgi:hypothetical protein